MKNPEPWLNVPGLS